MVANTILLKISFFKICFTERLQNLWKKHHEYSNVIDKVFVRALHFGL
jgi:hypothetical protein